MPGEVQRILKRRANKQEGKREAKERVDANYIETYKDDFEQSMQDFLGDPGSANRESIKNLVLELLFTMFFEPEKIDPRKEIKSLVSNSLQQPFKDEPVKHSAFLEYFYQKIGGRIFDCIEESLKEIKDFYVACLNNAENRQAADIVLVDGVDHRALLFEFNVMIIKKFLEKWRKELKKPGKSRIEPIEKSFFKRSVKNFIFYYFAVFVLMIASVPFLSLLFDPDVVLFKDPRFRNLGIGTFSLLISYFIVANFFGKKIKNNIKNILFADLKQSVYLEWHEEDQTGRKIRKIFFKIRVKPPARDASLDAKLPNNMVKRLKGKGSAPLAVVEEASSSPTHKADEISADEDIAITGLYRLDRISHFGDKEVYGYIPPETEISDEDRAVFEGILQVAAIVTSEGAQGIKSLSSKKLIDPGSSKKYLAWEIKRKDVRSSGDRLLGVACPVRRKNGKKCIVLVFNTYDEKGRATATELTNALNMSLPPGFFADQEQDASLSNDMPAGASNNSPLSGSHSPTVSPSLSESKEEAEAECTDDGTLTSSSSFNSSSSSGPTVSNSSILPSQTHILANSLSTVISSRNFAAANTMASAALPPVLAVDRLDSLSIEELQKNLAELSERKYILEEFIDNGELGYVAELKEVDQQRTELLQRMRSLGLVAEESISSAPFV